MLKPINLRYLSELSSSDRSFLSMYFKSPSDFDRLQSDLLKTTDESNTIDEKESLKENLNLIGELLKSRTEQDKSICAFSCWLLDFVVIYDLPIEIKECVWIDSSPYIRPLAEFVDEYENAAVVLADNKSARIYLVTLAKAGNAETVHGNVKNHVRKGGWSQQRYERRRDKQLMVYSREIIDRLIAVFHADKINHIIVAGGREIIQSLLKNMPEYLQEITTTKNIDLNKSKSEVNEDISQLFQEAERRRETSLWAKIRCESLRRGLGVIGIEAVLKAVNEGRVDTMLVSKKLKHEGRRCRDCEHFMLDQISICAECGSKSVYPVDSIEELVELVEKQGGTTDFADPDQTLINSGSIAALLRW